jgi:hypothetical protein
MALTIRWNSTTCTSNRGTPEPKQSLLHFLNSRRGLSLPDSPAFFMSVTVLDALRR